MALQPVQVILAPASANCAPLAPCGFCVQTRFTSSGPLMTHKLGLVWKVRPVTTAIARPKEADWPLALTDPPKSDVAWPSMLVLVTVKVPPSCSTRLKLVLWSEP